MFKKLDIKMRLFVSFGIVIVLSLIMAIASISGLAISRKKLTEFTEGSFLTDISVKMIRIDSSLAAIALRDMYITDDHSSYPELQATMNEYLVDLDQRLQDLKDNPDSDAELVGNLETKIHEWKECAELILEAILAGDDKTAQDLIVNQCSPLLEEMKLASAELDELTFLQQEEVLASSLDIAQTTTLLILGLLLVSIAISLVISLKLTMSIVNPLKELEDASANMAKGQLNTEITYSNNDAVGRLADSMIKSSNTIKEYISDIDRIMTELSKGNFCVELNKEYIGDFSNIDTSIRKFIGDTSGTLL